MSHELLRKIINERAVKGYWQDINYYNPHNNYYML